MVPVTTPPFVQDPQAVINYGVDWSQRYPADTITSATLVPSTGITVGPAKINGLQVLFTVSGGTADNSYQVRVDTMFASGQTDWYTMQFFIQPT